MVLKYKTRGNVSPKGKAKVYFCCHEKDFDRYFDIISDELLELCSCSVWYKGEKGTADSDDLGEMSLFVMPVTSQLMYTENDALKTEFAFALNNNIPVLPVMMEDGLVQIFNEKCGDIQFLDRNNADITAISYKEKLGKYLNSVLIGDELAEKIRAAFDAYIFLSYRKKDRKYAQELMKLIHKNDFCRDIAIWYDEFLTPGEDFNDSIKAALEKSGLFVMTVTPNLVNEENYIVNTEYPMAKKAHKPVVPFEMVPTDREKLNEIFEELPAVADSKNHVVVTETLLEAVKKLAIKENDGSPQHNFFIGLAYLGGVDVEVDYERALELITYAAERGLSEADKKLVEMYNNGIGVQRDRKIAVKWQEKLIDDLEKEDSDDLFYEIIECGDMYNELYNYNKAAEKFEYALSHVIDERTEALTNNRLGNTAEKQGKFEKAAEYFEKAFAIDRKIKEETRTIESYTDLAVSCANMADIYSKKGDLEKARELRFEAVELYKAVLPQLNLPEYRHGIFVQYNKLGNIEKEQGDFAQAEKYYKDAAEIVLQLVSEDDNALYLRDLSVTYDKLGVLYEENDKRDSAREYYGKALEICEQLVEKTDMPQHWRDLAVGLNRIGIMLREEDREDEAKPYHERALGIFERLVNEYNTPEFRDDLGLTYFYMLAVTYEGTYLYKSMDLYRDLCLEYPENKQYRNNLDALEEILG